MSPLPIASPLFELESVKIASPCSMDWAAMTGDQIKRHCSACDLNVYNLSRMTRDEAVAFVLEQEGKSDTCVRFFRRADGMVLTQDCPVGLKARIKRRVVASWQPRPRC